MYVDFKNWQVKYIDIWQVACIYMYVDFLSWQVEYIDIQQVAYIYIYMYVDFTLIFGRFDGIYMYVDF